MASPATRQVSENKAIPRRILISDPTDIPGSYSSTPGGTLYSTTPGGTKIVYERSFLMNLRNSPISKTPPNWEIPNQLLKGSPSAPKLEKGGHHHNKRPFKNHHQHHNYNHQNHHSNNGKENSATDECEQFQMDM